MTTLEMLEKMGAQAEHLHLAPAQFPPAAMDRLIDDWREAAAEEWGRGLLLEFAFSAGFALVLRGFRVMRRVFGLYGGYR